MDSVREVWYLLVDGRGNASDNGSTDFLLISTKCSVAQFRKLVHAENPLSVAAVADPHQLRVFADKRAFDTNSASSPSILKLSRTLDSLGDDDDNPLYVVVPDHVLKRKREVPKGKESSTTLQGLRDEFPVPSSFALVTSGRDSWIYWLQKEHRQIECHRIPTSNERYLVPLVLLHESFARFQNNCTNIDIGKFDCDFMVQFYTAMSDAYKVEKDLAEKARAILSPYLLFKLEGGPTIREAVVKDCKSDGSYHYLNSLLLNLEVKLQKGQGGGDPMMQNIAYYVKNFPDKIERAMPCFLLDICGPLLSVFGIVNVGDEYVLCEPLVESIPLYYFQNPQMLEKASRVCASLKDAMRHLTSWYEGLLSGVDVDVNRCRFPYHDSATIDGDKVQIRYSAPLKGRYVFAANVVPSGRDVVVKFAKQYGKDVHEYCYDKGFAPELLHHEVLLSNWVFVVMEKLELEPILSAQVEKELIRAELVKIKKHLADSSFVHGDLRECNILWDSTNRRVVVIDFDWSGKHDSDSYPLFMNPDIAWPEGAETNMHLLKEHDVFWIDQLLKSF